MLLTPNAQVRAARICLILLALAVLLLQALRLPAPISAASALGCAFLATFGAMIAFPWIRKQDIFRAILLIVAAIALSGLLTDQAEAVPNGFAALFGAAAAYLPVGIERTRSRARRHGDLFVEVIEANERRRQSPPVRKEPVSAVDLRQRRAAS